VTPSDTAGGPGQHHRSTGKIIKSEFNGQCLSGIQWKKTTFRRREKSKSSPRNPILSWIQFFTFESELDFAVWVCSKA